MTLLTVRFLLPLPNCFLKVRVPTLFAAVLMFFLPLKTSALSGAANSNKSAPTRFAAGTIYLRRNEIAVLPITCGCAPNLRPRCRPMPLLNGISTCLKAANVQRLLSWKWNSEAFLNTKKRRAMPTDTKVFSPLVSLESMWRLRKKNSEQRSEL